MVKVSYIPAQEIVVHEVVELPREDLIKERITPQGSVPLYWCDGILFAFSSFPLEGDVLKDHMRGIIHWLEVHFAKMPEYQSVISFSDEEVKTTMHIRIIDTRRSQVHKDFIKWLKGNIKSNK